MRDFVARLESLAKIEFWAATTIFVFAVFFLTTPAVEQDLSGVVTPNKRFFEEANIPFNYYRNYFLPQLFRYVVLFLSFLALNFLVVPRLIRKESFSRNTFLAVLIFLGLGVVFGTTDTYLKNYVFGDFESRQDAYNFLFQSGFLYAAWLMLMFGFYSVMKHATLHFLAHLETTESKYRIIIRDGLTAFELWMISMFFLVVGGAEGDFILAWGIIIPFGILLYCFSCYMLIPRSLVRRNPFRNFILKIFLVLLVSAVPVGLLGVIITDNEEVSTAIGMFNAAFQLFITAPVSWVLFKRQIRGNEEIFVLKRELGQSNANFDFLRSQINPHFLFNALNTIYGTAIQERAERTGEGIEKLGEMMRFMLQENMQEKIPLVREIEYLDNYIGLQKLRTDANPNVRIHTTIQNEVNGVQISPMLLIPFVENAFKHGISFREPSHISITLEVNDDTLVFDVHNSKHLKRETDPEKHKSGIGLNNVKQRLQLLYPNRHELIIRENGKEFFVHLTLQLYQ